MKFFVVDVETTIKNRGDGAVGDFSASVYNPKNKIVMLGERHAGVNNIFINNEDSWSGSIVHNIPTCLKVAASEPVLLVGHHVTFDWRYIYATWDVTCPRVINNIHIWDTQQVAYLLSGQTKMYPSLDECAVEAGGTVKNDAIAAYWESGVDTELIPANELREYLEGDLENTDKVFRYQYEIVSKIPSLFALVKTKMDDLLCTSMMEWNGMAFDLSKAAGLIEINERAIESNKSSAECMVAGLFVADFEWNPLSNEHVSIALFGGEYKVRESLPVYVGGVQQFYKTGPRAGTPKTKLEDVVYSTTGLGLTPPKEKAKKSGIYKVSDDVLDRYEHVPLVWHIRKIRELTKETETYYRGYSALVWPSGKIHPTINHCSTRTGRQSCTKPNLQNVTREE